ncbi:hypothetical protein VN97_g9814 [Penicillium thymicola]|uniref:Uncharacterized protein n=1 Tax=Penicillium thymicola TaxID=293382 RepID=A0AAI9TAI3_PENTH|nr:hypothetical protein VN97_g9814 [Penicillium thymicola]
MKMVIASLSKRTSRVNRLDRSRNICDSLETHGTSLYRGPGRFYPRLYKMCYICPFIVQISTYDHRVWKIGLPVRSAVLKHRILHGQYSMCP